MGDPEARCATASRARSEVLVGTASRVVRWLLLEQPGPWGKEALVDSRLDEQTGRVLQSASRRHGFRALVVRRPGWDTSDGPRRAYLVRTRQQGGWVEQLDIEDPRQLWDVPWEALDAVEAPGVAQPGPASLHLVCTNGKHDPCCADRGRPVVRALQEAGTPEVWESSHVGGDRFAANIVCLPRGVYFGRVEPDEAPALLEDFAAGTLWLDRYRGRSCLSSLAQAAEHFVRQETGERRLDSVRVLSVRTEGGSSTVRLDHDGEPVRAVVTRHKAAAATLSCGAAPVEPWSYRLESLTVGAP